MAALTPTADVQRARREREIDEFLLALCWEDLAYAQE
jgi:hypothetical protein